MARSPLAPKTDGWKQLVDWLAPKQRSASALAALLGITQPAVRGWVERLSRPKPEYREALERACGIPAEDWETERERSQRERAKAELEARLAKQGGAA